MRTNKQVKANEYSKENNPDEEYIFARLMGYIISGIGIFFMFFKIMNPY